MTLFLFYTDPGSGVMLLQVLLAFVAGGVFYFRNLIRRALGTGKLNNSTTDVATPQPNSNPGTDA